MTLKEAQADLRNWGMSLRCVDGEYQVKVAGRSSWDGPRVYFTNDLEDALVTGKCMSKVAWSSKYPIARP